MREFFLDLLRSPSAFYDEPGKYARNQIAHTLLVGWLPGRAALAATAVHPILGAAVAVLFMGGYLIWEWVQFRRYAATLDDFFEDLGHVYGGFFTGFLQVEIMLFIHAILIQSGYIWRKRNG